MNMYQIIFGSLEYWEQVDESGKSDISHVDNMTIYANIVIIIISIFIL